MNQHYQFSRFLLRAFVFASLVSFSWVSCGIAQDLATVIEECEKSVVRIETGDGMGSGYIVSENGIFVTNVHVLAGATKAVAILPNNRKYEITGTYHIDKSRDICVAQLKAINMTPIKFAKALPRKGENVTALGSPMGLDFTATRGIVSAIRDGASLGKDMGDSTMQGTWIQTDAAISPGNSGGPLINPTGEVVAMSTLASTGGRAQNLNFGISIKDIKSAVGKAMNAELVSLADGIGKVTDAGSGGSGLDANIRRRAVPEKAFSYYIQRGQEEYKSLCKNVRVETTKRTAELKEMQRGNIGIPAPVKSTFGIYGGAELPTPTYTPTGIPGVSVVQGRLRKTYYFDSVSIKNRVIRRKEGRLTKLKTLKSRLAKGTADEGLAAILSGAGPSIDVQEKSSIGFMEGARVIIAFSDNSIAVEYQGTPFLMWVDSTVGLSTGQELSPNVAFVAGTETISIPKRGSISVTVLQEVPDEELQAIIDDRLLYKTWKAGKFEIEAKMLKNDGTTLTLEKRDGTTIEVPLSRLDAESQATANRK